MNQRTDFINTLSYELINKFYLFPVRTQSGGFAVFESLCVLQKESSSNTFLYKIIDTAFSDFDFLMSDIRKMQDHALSAIHSRTKPFFITYCLIIHSNQLEKYKTALSDNLSSPEYKDISLSVILILWDEIKGSTDYVSTGNDNRIQKQIYAEAISVYDKMGMTETRVYSRDDIIHHTQEISHKSRSWGKIKGFSITKLIIFINILIFIGGLVSENLTGENVFYTYGIQFTPYIVINNEYRRLITAIFLHADLIHLLSNAYFLYICGEMVESACGKIKFILIYFITGLGGNVLSLFLSDPSVASLGASGACLGLGGIITFMWIRRKNNFLRYSQNISSLIGMILFNVVYGFFVTGIDNWAHLGGFVTGILMGLLGLLLNIIFRSGNS